LRWEESGELHDLHEDEIGCHRLLDPTAQVFHDTLVAFHVLAVFGQIVFVVIVVDNGLVEQQFVDVVAPEHHHHKFGFPTAEWSGFHSSP